MLKQRNCNILRQNSKHTLLALYTQSYHSLVQIKIKGQDLLCLGTLYNASYPFSTGVNGIIKVKSDPLSIYDRHSCFAGCFLS